MSRKICVFPPNCSDSQLSDCSRHHHLSKRDAREKEQRGEIVRLDVAGTKFIEIGPLGIGAERKYKTLPHPKITRETIERAVAGSRKEAQRARRQIEEFGSREVAIPNLTFDASDVWIGTERGEPVTARLRRLDDDVAENAATYLTFQDFYSRGHSGKGIENLVAFFERRRADLASVIGIWDAVAVQFEAGEFSAPLNRMRADRLPTAVVRFTLQAYLSQRISSRR